MKKNSLQLVVAFIFKYIWAVCVSLIILEAASACYSAVVLMKQSSLSILTIVNSEIYSRVSSIENLLNGLVKDERVKNTKLDLYDRVQVLVPFKESYKLYMLALCDENVNVMSVNLASRNRKLTSLAHRDYMQRLYSTGEVQITDVFPAGMDNKTLNYTIAVPIKENNKVVGCIFGAMYFEDTEKILYNAGFTKDNYLVLLSSTNKIMSKGRPEHYNKNVVDLAKAGYTFNTTIENVLLELQNKKSGSYWGLSEGGLYYTTFMPVEGTNWGLLHRISFFSILKNVMPAFVLKCLFYIIVCFLLNLYGKKYIIHQLLPINQLVDKVNTLQQELYHLSEVHEDNYLSVLELSKKGLIDEITGLYTRTVFLEKLTAVLENQYISDHAALFFIDLDNLKYINDTYGHDLGDRAIRHFGLTLKSLSLEYGAIVGRYGGDEFLFFVDTLQSHEELVALAQTIVAQLSTEISSSGQNVHIHGSIGIAIYPKHANSVDELIGKADTALYQAKKAGRNTYVIYTEENT